MRHPPGSWDEAFSVDYHEWSAHMTEDIAFYVELACEADGPLVELAIGNGRVAIPVAQATGQRVAASADLVRPASHVRKSRRIPSARRPLRLERLHVRYAVADNRVDMILDDGSTSSLWWATKNEWLGLLDVAGLQLEAL